ncbi:aminopeptidase [Eubacteriales bacterium OttesenSCG-928-G02]|nr:aminopeptidase [Eubacteriales bacterium OttesenSCG-928-G02]
MEKKDLFYERKIPIKTNPEFKEKAYEYCEGYKEFINYAKTEREAVAYSLDIAKKNGYTEYKGQSLKAGDKIYYTSHNKAVIYSVIGKDLLNSGVRMMISHVDSPRLDLKQVPLYEDKNISYFKTHYYGGIKKYQWTAIPLSLHGVIIKTDGTSLTINIGESENDPVFYISDLMPHIGKDQNSKTLAEGIAGEELNIINGSIPFDDEEGSVKYAVLKVINEKYGITERDFITAEISAVPAIKAKDVGFDKSMVAAYGHDDKICAYPSFKALMQQEDVPQKTAVCVFADKEEIGSVGITGMDSDLVKNFLKRICISTQSDYYTCIENSICLSADVSGAFDPCFAAAYEYNNSPRINNGIVLTKYTGARGKSGSNDASAELFAKLVKIFDKADIAWQTGEIGKVDQGGAGTVASEIARLGMEVIDAGVPLLAMHSTTELAAKSDIYTMHLASDAFYKS